MNTVPKIFDGHPALSIYHANARGTGSALKFTLHPASELCEGSICLRTANQTSVGTIRNGARIPHGFDWDGGICVKLEFNDLCKMLQVFRGELEQIEDGRGIYHAYAEYTQIIRLRHALEPIPGYWLEVDQHNKADGSDAKFHLLICPSEALGVCYTFESSLALVAFGIPKPFTETL